MLPFLKKAKEGGASAPVESVERKPDEEPSYDMLDAIADDILSAIKSDNKELLKSALTAFQDLDKQQDQETMKG